MKTQDRFTYGDASVSTCESPGCVSAEVEVVGAVGRSGQRGVTLAAWERLPVDGGPPVQDAVARGAPDAPLVVREHTLRVSSRALKQRHTVTLSTPRRMNR